MNAPAGAAAAADAMSARNLLRDVRGNVAMITALTLVPLMGAGGLAVDYQRALSAQAFLQHQVDQAAINAAAAGTMSNSTRWLAEATRAAREVYPDEDALRGLSVTGEWVASNQFQARATAAMPILLYRVMPGAPDEMEIEVAATAQVTEPILIYGRPTVASLDPEAGDYNRISVYCYNAEDEAAGRSGFRKQMTTIADNGGTTFVYTMPTCAAGEVMSYRLENVRGARTNPSRWNNPTAERYEYFTDTQLVNGAETYDLGGWQILETVLCDTLTACRNQSAGGVIPTGRNRTPSRATQACAPGKYMYYGWEDRPPGRGWTDQDYDDIRVIIGCPTVQRSGDKLVRLVD